MVHRKSTYRLMFKNIHTNTRKNIWAENVYLREMRRHKEMSHHSIDDEDVTCQCDEESESSYSDGESPPAVSHEEEIKDTNELIRKKHTGPDEIYKDTEDAKISKSLLIKEPESGATIRRTDRISERKSDSRQLSKSSEAILRDLSKSSANRGVMKFSPATGEYDLIPSVGENRPPDQPTKRRGTSGRSRSLMAWQDRGVVNIRPLTVSFSPQEAKSVRSKSASHAKTPILRCRSSDAVFSTPEAVDGYNGMTLVSRRREPRTQGLKLGYPLHCTHCGKLMREKPVKL